MNNLPAPQIIDIQSPAQTGKTHFLYHLISQTILPDYFPHHIVRITSSPAKAVFFIDCDGCFDIYRLRRIIATFIKDKFAESLKGGFIHNSSVPNPSEDEINHAVITALSNLYIFHPTSGIGLLSVVKGLPTFLSQPENKSLTLGLICIDSLSAFHHVLRAGDKIPEYYTQLSTSLRSLSSLLGIPILTTSWSLFAQTTNQIQGRGYMGVGPSHPRSVSTHRPEWRQYFPMEWLRAIDQRIILQKREVRGFVTGISLVEAEMEREKRMEVVKRGAVMGWLENDGKKEFEMFITDEGIRISS